MDAPVSLETMRELYRFNRWAHERALAMAEGLSQDDFLRDMRTSHGSVAGTLVHAMWSEWIWLRRWKGESPRVMFDAADYPSVAGVRSRWDEVWSEQSAFLGSLTPQRLREPLAYLNVAGERWEYPLWQELLHVVNHGSYHRGQVVTLLRQSGKPAVTTDFLVFYDETGPRP
ncbi:MAG: hypothetical protein DMF81_03550 [Acidobacteria bacterium]|nr:MAG: hypothetical protein DMF81_03550 [Acidobacteriota bacterium]